LTRWIFELPGDETIQMHNRLLAASGWKDRQDVFRLAPNLVRARPFSETATSLLTREWKTTEQAEQDNQNSRRRRHPASDRASRQSSVDLSLTKGGLLDNDIVA
jgi:hypothetical protein